MLLHKLQNLLVQVYGIDIAANVTDYLITDKSVLASRSDSSVSNADEVLFLLEENGTLDISLYLNDLLLQRLTASNPYAGLSHSNLDDFCKVLEGVSHFVCVAWNALNDKSVTRLELELQAEIDKYVSTRVLIASQSEPGITSNNLVKHLFDDIEYHDGLAVDELEAKRIAIPPFDAAYLEEGLAVHFRCHIPEAAGIRIDVMAVLRGVDPFPDLWARRTTIELAPEDTVELLALPDLVKAKKDERINFFSKE